MRATAAVLRDPSGPYVIEEVELAEPGPGELLVRVVGAGVCHTDSLLRHLPGDMLPIIGGHEGAGVVERVGPGVVGIAVGDHVVLSFDSCGTCRPCRTAQPSYCDEFMLRNLAGRRFDGPPAAVDGAGSPVGSRWFGQSSFATHAIATARNAVVVSRDLDLELLGPLGCGIQTGAGSILTSLQVRPGSSLVVFGAGAVGLAAVMAGVVAGASTIIAVDLQQPRLELALSLGATAAIDASVSSELAAEVHALTAGGADYAFDTTGASEVVAAAIASLRMTGSCGLVGADQQGLQLAPGALIGKTVKGILEGDAVPQVLIPQLIDHWQAGRFPFDRLTQAYPLSEINEAERASLEGRVVKPVLLPGT